MQAESLQETEQDSTEFMLCAVGSNQNSEVALVHRDAGSLDQVWDWFH